MTSAARPTATSPARGEVISSYIVPGLEKASVALGMWPPCGCRERPLVPHDLVRDGDTIELRCPTCAALIFAAELIVEEPEDHPELSRVQRDRGAAP
jgi:hypothetical protein